MTSWPEYVTWFTARYESLAAAFLADGAYECNGGPTLSPTDFRYPNSPPWKTDWAIVFSDGKYFRVKESFKRLGRPNVGMGEREHLSFHYGFRHPQDDAKGFPKSTPQDNPPPADLRIDIDKDLNPHIHAGSAEHIYQNRVDGYSIPDANMFDFLEAVKIHRETGRIITEILGIKVQTRNLT